MQGILSDYAGADGIEEFIFTSMLASNQLGNEIMFQMRQGPNRVVLGEWKLRC